MKKSILIKSIESAEIEAREEGKNLYEWMNENDYEFTESRTHIEKFVDVFSELKEFFKSENVPCSLDEKYNDTMRFKSYGTIYSIRYDKTKNEFTFCCELYKDIKSLIKAINKKCRGFDGKLA